MDFAIKKPMAIAPLCWRNTSATLEGRF